MKEPIKRISRLDYGHMWPVRIDELHLRTLSLFNSYTYLPMDWIHELLSPEGVIGTTRDRLRLLAAHPNRYLDKPKAQGKREDNKNNYILIYSRNPDGAKLLQKHGWPVTLKSPTNDLSHRFMEDVGMASIALGLRDAGITAIEVPKPWVIPRVSIVYQHLFITKDQEADRIFGLQYPDIARYFFVEFDRATEDLSGAHTDRKTWVRSILQYQTIAKDRLYNHLGMRNMHVLIVTVNESYKNSIMKLVSELVEPKYQKMFAFQVAPYKYLKAPKPSGFLFSTPWERVSHPPLDLANVKS